MKNQRAHTGSQKYISPSHVCSQILRWPVLKNCWSTMYCQLKVSVIPRHRNWQPVIYSRQDHDSLWFFNPNSPESIYAFCVPFLCQHRCPQSPHSQKMNHFRGKDTDLQVLSSTGCLYHNGQRPASCQPILNWWPENLLLNTVFTMSRHTAPAVESKQVFKVMWIGSSRLDLDPNVVITIKITIL